MSAYIDPALWPRKPVCDFFSGCEYPFYDLCARAEAGTLYRRTKAEGLSFYMCMVWAVMSALNGTEAFLYKLRADGIYRHDYLSPSFTDSGADGLLRIVSLDWRPGEEMADFARRARAEADAQTERFPSQESEARDDFAYLTCLPWLDFTALGNEHRLDPNDSAPRIGWGRLAADGTLPVSVDVNHRLIDGQHIAEFFSALNTFTSR